MEKKTERLASLDTLRGMDMFWIIGGGTIVTQLAKCTDSTVIDWMAGQMRHPSWHGFSFFDLIFPLFIFMAGVSLPFSVNSKLNKGVTKKQITLGIVKRTILLIFLGVVFNGLFRMDFGNLRICSVLSRIGIATGLGGLIFLWAKDKYILPICGGILLFYWILLTCFAAPGFEAGDLTMQGNVVSYLDSLVTPGKLYLKIHDPEGLMTNIPAVVNALLGIISGLWLINREKSQMHKFYLHLIGGGICVVISLIWNEFLPFNKNLWTSSFVMLTGGLSFLLMGLFYFIIDVKGFKKWTFPFRLIGMNSILIYMAACGGIFNFGHLNWYFFNGISRFLEKANRGLFMAFTLILIELLFLFICYRRKIFLKV